MRHNGAMTRAFDVRNAAAWFRLIAFAEALSWIGLLTGMYFKYLGTPRTEVGVKIFGPVHGGVFIAFLVAAVLTGMALKWGAGTWLLALLGSIVPLGSVIFLLLADRTGRMGSDPVAAGAGQPGRTAPETT
ncbi:membrane protein [Mycolicibacterium psychrotolerans]|uniref:Membrane protein n=2 Tax=Mycolicibacterium psychrotolerans TaxID=216929 RepID=A0A7I7MAK1_9MYCO|nr:membrane protein [Mycolicibacterium psychrotolerans]